MDVSVSKQVDCVSCGKPVAVHAADIVGNGYRCSACSANAHVGELRGRSDAAAHLTGDERAQLKRKAQREVAGGAVAIVAGIALTVLLGLRRAWLLSLVGVGMVAKGISTWRHVR